MFRIVTPVVRRDNYRRLGAVIDRSLSSDGRGSTHSIGRNKPPAMDPWSEHAASDRRCRSRLRRCPRLPGDGRGCRDCGERARAVARGQRHCERPGPRADRKPAATRRDRLSTGVKQAPALRIREPGPELQLRGVFSKPYAPSSCLTARPRATRIGFKCVPVAWTSCRTTGTRRLWDRLRLAAHGRRQSSHRSQLIQNR